MPTFRDNPYGAFNFIVALGGTQGDGAEGTIVGGFSDVSGLGIEVSYSEYRNGNEKFNTVRKVPNTHKHDDVTLKRGLIGSDDLFALAQGRPRRRRPTRATSRSRCSTRRATPVATFDAAQRAAEEVGRADARRQGRRRGGDGGAAPRPRRHRVQVGQSPHGHPRFRSLGAPGLYLGAPDAHPRALGVSGWTCARSSAWRRAGRRGADTAEGAARPAVGRTVRRRGGELGRVPAQVTAASKAPACCRTRSPRSSRRAAAARTSCASSTTTAVRMAR